MQVAKCSKNNHRQENDTSSPLSTKLNFFIKRICDKEKLSEYEIHKRCLTGNDNFFSVLYEVDVKGRTEDEEKELHLFMKHIVHTEMYAVSNMFETELFAYTDMFEKFVELQEQANVNLQERYKTTKIYKDSNAEILILENLAKKGFTTNPRTDVAPWNFFQMSVKELAKFHALSFVLRETKPEYFNKKIKSMKYTPLIKESWKYAIASARKASIKAVDEIFEHKVEKAYDLLMDKVCKYYNDETIKVCLCHGDYRSGNIMMKLNDNGIPEIIPIDYQMMYYGNPVFDFLYFIYTSTDRKFRKTHFLTSKDLYYETLSNFLNYFQLDVNLVYPKEDYEKVFEEKLDFGLITAIYILPFILSSGNQVPDITHEEVQFNLDDTFKYRLQEVIEEYMEWGLI